MSKNQPGFWYVGEERHGYDYIIRSKLKNDPICSGVIAGYPKAEARANAYLIAAAPELLYALKAVMKAEIIYTGAIEEAFDPNGPDDLVALCRAAIAKAEGKP